MTMAKPIDAITLELIKGTVQSARREMEALIDRTSMSPFIREKKDYFTAIFDGQGQLVVSTALTLAAGNLIDCVFERYPAQTMQPGDLYLYNDSYGSKGAVSHNNDMVFIQPIYAEGRLIGFAEGWGHLWDIGGMVPGSISPAATDVFQEGIVIPPTRVLRDGVWNDDLIAMFMRNTRFPIMVKGDFSALTAAVQLGRRRMEEIAAQFGADVVEAAFAAIIDETERATRAAVAANVPDGRFSFRDWIDGDCVTDNSYSVAVTIEKQGDRLDFDFSATDDQAKGAINFIMDPAVPKGILGLYLTSREPGILPNAGYRRAMGNVTIRPGSLLAPREPAPLGMRSHAVMRVNSSIFASLAKATGGNAAAASSVYVLYYLRSLHKMTGKLDLCIEGLAVGFGARPFGDGIDAVYYVAQKNYPGRVRRDGVRRPDRGLRHASRFGRPRPLARRHGHRSRLADHRRRSGDRRPHGQHPLSRVRRRWWHGRPAGTHYRQSGACGRATAQAAVGRQRLEEGRRCPDHDARRRRLGIAARPADGAGARRRARRVHFTSKCTR